MSVATMRRAVPRALIVCSGGLDERGGVGRVVRYFSRAWLGQADRPEFEIIATTGDLRGLKAVPAFARAFAAVTAKLVTRRFDLVHVHMAGYGSVIRKGLIL